MTRIDTLLKTLVMLVIVLFALYLVSNLEERIFRKEVQSIHELDQGTSDHP